MTLSRSFSENEDDLRKNKVLSDLRKRPDCKYLTHSVPIDCVDASESFDQSAGSQLERFDKLKNQPYRLNP